MGFLLPQRPIRGDMVSSLGPFSNWSIRRKLLATVIPLITLLLGSTGFAAKMLSGKYLALALERTTKVLTMGQADAVSDLLEHARQDILLLARGPRDEQTLRAFMELEAAEKPGVYREAAFLPAGGDNHVLLVSTGREIVRLGKDQGAMVINSPLLAPSRLGEAKPGVVTLLPLSETAYSPGLLPQSRSGAAFTVLRLVTPVADQQGRLAGYWILSLDAKALRDVLSLYNSPKSPLAAFVRTPVKRYSFFFDQQGWILFQSANIEEKDQPLTTDTARAGMAGDHGMPGFPGAFRPSTANETYWRMVVDIQGGQPGVESLNLDLDPVAPTHDIYSMGYAPVFFKGNPERPEVVGGVAFMDKSLLLLAQEYRFYDVLLVIFMLAVVLSALLVALVSKIITRPMRELAEAVRAMPRDGVLGPVELSSGDQETLTLKESINNLIEAVLFHREELRIKDAYLQDHLRRQPLDLDEKMSQLTDEEPLEGLIGVSSAMRELKWLIRKAASVDPDVLIIGETGTGKEVTSQAIHRLSRRADGPFISVNCGALDENLLLDALFGHVKGAFTEAKTDRKGAFLAAQGGTILLDEIGNASPKVQQALLRALAARTIIPLGSDVEVPFDARVIAATNVDLLDLAERGQFREDLYYRLRVLSLHTPSLRDRSEDIPLLVNSFLKESAKVMNKPLPTLSRGAWERIAAHDWPGNVRELKHCIMRAVAMADTSTILVEDLRFDMGMTGLERKGQPAEGQTRIEDPQAVRPQSRDAWPNKPRAPQEGVDGERALGPAGPDQSRKTAPLDRAGQPGGDAPDSSEVKRAAMPRAQDTAGRDGRYAAAGASPARDAAAGRAVQAVEGLNDRQRKGLAYLLEHGAMSRAQYQTIVGSKVPPRTAQYDLRDMTDKGIVAVRGKGPATRYVLADGAAVL